MRQLLGELIPQSRVWAVRPEVIKERMVVGEYPPGVDGKSHGF